MKASAVISVPFLYVLQFCSPFISNFLNFFFHFFAFFQFFEVFVPFLYVLVRLSYLSISFLIFAIDSTISSSGSLGTGYDFPVFHATYFSVFIIFRSRNNTYHSFKTCV